MANDANSDDRHSELYTKSQIGLCYLDTELRFVCINEWLADINGLSVQKHLGRRISDVLPDVAKGVESQFRRVIKTGEPIIDGTVVAETPAHPGVERHFQHNYLPVKSNEGTVVGISCVVHDITELKKSEEYRISQLTSRERKVMDLLVAGMSMKQIARELQISLATCSRRRTNVLKKLDVENDVQLARRVNAWKRH